MKYRLKTDSSVTVEACDVGGTEMVEIPTSVFNDIFELAPGLREAIDAALDPLSYLTLQDDRDKP